MRKYFISFVIGLLFFTACTKPIDDVIEKELFSPPYSGFILYTIKQGDHFIENNFLLVSRLAIVALDDVCVGYTFVR